MTKARNVSKCLALSGTSMLVAALLAAAPAQAQTTDAGSGADQAAPANTSISQSASNGAAQDDANEIVVTGSSIRGVPPTGSNLISVTRDDIEKIGTITTPDLLATVPQLNSFNTAPRASA
jgi:iron complex outermembrane receptor protein